MTELRDPHDAIDFIFHESPAYAKAKSDRIYLEHFRKSKKALLMAECTERAVNAREQHAYGHPGYVALLEGLRAAVELEETLRWRLVAAQARVEVWKAESYLNGRTDRAAS